jgi:hypothetical protein
LLAGDRRQRVEKIARRSGQAVEPAYSMSARFAFKMVAKKRI